MGDTEKDKRDDEALHFVMHNTIEVVARQMSRDMANIAELKQKRDELLAALKAISNIPNKSYGGDWDEIEEARAIAKAAISKCDA
jgi:hypothetical protein